MITDSRDQLAGQMAEELDAAEFHGHEISAGRAHELTSAAVNLAAYVEALDEE